MALRRIGQILVDLGFLSEDRVKVILEEQRQRPSELFGQVAIGMGLLSDEHLVQGLAEQMGLQVINLAELVVPPSVLAMITEPMAQLYRVVPVSFEENTITIAMCDPQKLSVVDELRSFLGYDVRAVVATEKDVLKALTRYYAAGGESVEGLIADMEQDVDLAAAAAALEKGVLDLNERRGPGRQRPGPQAPEHGPADGHQGPGQRPALRALRERIQDSHPRRRRTV